MVKSRKLVLVDDTPAAPVDEDDSALIDRKELKRREQVLAQQVAGAIMHQTAVTSKLARENTKENMRGKLKNFDKYEGEIDALLDKLDPTVAARADTIRNVHKVVVAQHMDEEIESEVEARLASRAEDEGEERGHIPGAMPSPQRSPAAMGGDASVGRVAARNRDVTIKPLSRDERIAAEIFGIKDAAEFRKYGDKSWRPDLLGSKGRTRF
jgi:hypothetical protein